MTRFDEIEERRERTIEGFAGQDEWDATLMDGLDDHPYELDDPKHPDHYETFAASWDMRGGK